MSALSNEQRSEVEQIVLRVFLTEQATAIYDLIYKDPHQWSTRPCDTCRTITALAHQPFGCYRLLNEQTKQKQARA